MRERERERERETVYIRITTVLPHFSVNSEAVALIPFEAMMLPARC